MMTATLFPVHLPRWRAILAGILLLVGISCLWMGAGLSALLPSITRAVADPAAVFSGKVPVSVLSARRADLLRSSVDTLALGLGGALDSLGSAGERSAALDKALSAVTFELGAHIYFTAWQGTRMLHSPRTPDTVGIDFADALDLRGVAFVRAMHELSAQGGFIRVSLPGPAHDASAAPLSATPGSPIDQIVYTRVIPGHDAHIAAFMPLNPVLDVAGAGFSSVWQDAAISTAETRQSRRDMRDGLCVSGMSLIGLAGVIVYPGRKERTSDSCAK